MDATHKVMLCRHNGRRLFDIIACLQTGFCRYSGNDFQYPPQERSKGKPYMLCTFLFHFCMDGSRNLVSGQKLIDKAFALAVEQNCTLAAGRFEIRKCLPGFSL